MKLRRGGPFRKEQPFSSINPEMEGDSRKDIDLRDLDLLIDQMIRQSHGASQCDSDPAEQLVRSEILKTFREMLHCLTPKEREIFEAAFFRHSPGQIAELLGTTTGSAYSHLSRSRHKLQRERIRVYIAGYVQRRRDGGKPNRVMLDGTEIYL